jgi:hypothetical protein
MPEDRMEKNDLRASCATRNIGSPADGLKPSVGEQAKPGTVSNAGGTTPYAWVVRKVGVR